ncbi:MAG: hypothetical protein M1836_000772 [Candelina mexicana]|nr:MAG: hypothetical protein M1836_000772 [Candelina mexicana]
MISSGLSGCVHTQNPNPYVFKVPLDIEQRREIEIEKRIYERLTEDGQQHGGLLEYLGSESHENGEAWALRLRKAEKGQLAVFILQEFASIDLGLKLKWARQLTDVLRYVHSKRVIHCDLGTHNILLDKDLDIKLIDFAGSSIDSSAPLVSCWVRNQPPWFDETGADEKADIFALGSVLYTIMTGRSPYYDRPNRDITALYRAYQFPDVGSLEAFGSVIDRCWRGKYGSADEVLAAVDEEVSKFMR